MPVFFERYLLPLAATLTVLFVFTNPMNFDWTQRITGGLALLFFAYFVAHTTHKLNNAPSPQAEAPTPHTLQEKVSPVPPEESTGSNPPVIPPATPHFFFGTQMVLPDGRTIISCNPKDLRRVYHEKTLDQFNRMLGGKWVKISGKIDQNDGTGRVFLAQGLTESPLIILRFGKAWIEQLSAQGRGTDVTIRGKIMEADLLSITLVECELL